MNGVGRVDDETKKAFEEEYPSYAKSRSKMNFQTGRRTLTDGPGVAQLSPTMEGENAAAAGAFFHE